MTLMALNEELFSSLSFVTHGLKQMGELFSPLPLMALKIVCHEIFDLHFSHDSNPPRPLMNRPKYFRIRFRFHRLRGVHDTAESKF